MPAEETRSAIASSSTPVTDEEPDPTEVSEDFPPATSQASTELSLRASFVPSPSTHYNVTVDFDEHANIPKNAELRIRKLEMLGNNEEDEHVADKSLQTTSGSRYGTPAHETQNTDDPRTSFEKALGLENTSRILQDTYLEVRIVADGTVVEPADEVNVTIETDAFDSAQSSAVEAAILSQDDTESRHLIPNNLTEAGANTKLSVRTERLGALALGVVVRELHTWQQRDLDVTLLGPRYGASFSFDAAPSPELEEGIVAQECVRIDSDPAPEHGMALWVEAVESETERCLAQAEDAEFEERLGGTVGFSMGNDMLHGMLFDAEGTTEPVAFDATEEQLLIAWDSGYRKATLEMQSITVEGMVPRGTTGTAQDLTQDYVDSAKVVREATDQEQTDANMPEYVTVAAYDITLEADGEQYQPGEEHPLTVTISDDGITSDKNLQLWHIHDDESVTEVSDVTFDEGTATFEATGFSTYLVTAADSSASETLSESFTLTATAASYSRSATVTFVDQDGNPLNATVAGTVHCSYTGVADESNSTNTVDLYSYIDKLDSAIADEYEFSRVYLHLNNGKGDQKDFRYVQVGDARNVSDTGSTTLYRAYINMKGIDQNRVNQDYNGTWYQLSLGGAMDPMFIEYYHVADASFYALDVRGNPVKDATFTLYTDSSCYYPLEYKDQTVTATSDRKGLVSFGKIPRGTYYMKETVIPDGFKKTTTIHTVVVDGETTLPNVIHEDDDGSVIVSDVFEMTVTKKWDDGKEHAGDVVGVTVSCDGETYTTFELSQETDWTYELANLDPNKSYVISETSIRNSQGEDLMPDWAPEIVTEANEEDQRVEYFRSTAFQQGKEYVLVINPGTSNSKALTGGDSLTPVALETSDGEVTGEVSDYMLWKVASISGDGVISLQNHGNDTYLDHTSKWIQNTEEPLFVRHTNEDGVITIYYRKNLNNTTSYYLWMVNRVDRTTKASDAADFALYSKLTVHSANVTITNKPTTYPVMIENVECPFDEALPGMTYDLYSKETYESGSSDGPLYEGLVAGADGYLTTAGSNTLNLEAGSYYLVQTTSDNDVYRPVFASSEESSTDTPLQFVVTRKGKIGVVGTYGMSDFEFCSSVTSGDVTYPLLRVPHYKIGTVELQLKVEGAYADRTKKFDFTLDLPEEISEIKAKVNGSSTVFTEDYRTVKLAHGDILQLEDISLAKSYSLKQAETDYTMSVVATDAAKASVTVDSADAYAFFLAAASTDDPDLGSVIITNSLIDETVYITGGEDNTGAWATVALVGLGALICQFALRRHRRSRQEHE